jgi:hypothetical protein
VYVFFSQSTSVFLITGENKVEIRPFDFIFYFFDKNKSYPSFINPSPPQPSLTLPLPR